FERADALLLRHLGDRLPAEFPFERLAAGDAAIEEHVMRLVREQRLGPNSDPHRRRRSIELLWLSFEWMKDVLVLVARLCGEVIPEEALHGMIVRADDRFVVRLRNEASEHLEAGHGVRFVLGWIDTLHLEPEEPFLAFGGCVDAEGHGVRARHGEHGVVIA